MKNRIIDGCTSLLLDDWPLPKVLRRWLCARPAIQARLEQVGKLESELRRDAIPPVREIQVATDKVDKPASFPNERPESHRFGIAIAASMALIVGAAVFAAFRNDDPVALEERDAWKPILASVSATKQMGEQLGGGLQEFGQTFGRVRQRLKLEWTQWQFIQPNEGAESSAVPDVSVQSELENVAKCLQDAVVVLQREPDSAAEMAEFLKLAKQKIETSNAIQTASGFASLRWSEDGKSLLTSGDQTIQCRIVKSSHDNYGPGGSAWLTTYEFSTQEPKQRIEITIEMQIP